MTVDEKLTKLYEFTTRFQSHIEGLRWTIHAGRTDCRPEFRDLMRESYKERWARLMKLNSEFLAWWDSEMMTRKDID